MTSRTDRADAAASEVADALRLFTKDGLHDDAQKRLLKKHALIDYSHGSWGLSPAGRAEAVRLGFLEPTDTELAAMPLDLGALARAGWKVTSYRVSRGKGVLDVDQGDRFAKFTGKPGQSFEDMLRALVARATEEGSGA